MAGGSCDSEDPITSGAARFADVFVVPPEGVGIVVAFMGIAVGSVDPVPGSGADAFTMRLIATTCERDCILCCCCSAGIGIPTDGGTAVVAVEDNEEEDVAVVLPLVLIRGLTFDTVVVVSTIGGSGGFITKCG